MRFACVRHCLASRVESVEELLIDNPSWDVKTIEEKVGIRKRYISGPEETALTLAIAAGTRTLRDYPDRHLIDGLVYVTQSPDSNVPATACHLHRELQLSDSCAAFDVNQGCSGFVYGLSIAHALIESCGLSRCLIVCAETYTKYISIHDRTCRPIFSDGASGVVVERHGDGHLGPFFFLTDGRGSENLTLCNDKHVRGRETNQALYMDGPKVLMFTMGAVPRAVQGLLDRAQLKKTDIDIFLFHQASKLVLDNLERLLKVHADKVYRNYVEVGNTVSSTIPIALEQLLANSSLQRGATLMMIGFGVGYSIAGCIYRH